MRKLLLNKNLRLCLYFDSSSLFHSSVLRPPSKACGLSTADVSAGHAYKGICEDKVMGMTERDRDVMLANERTLVRS